MSTAGLTFSALQVDDTLKIILRHRLNIEKLQSVALSNLEYEEFFGKIKEILLWKSLSSNMLHCIFLLSHFITVVHKIYIYIDVDCMCSCDGW